MIIFSKFIPNYLFCVIVEIMLHCLYILFNCFDFLKHNNELIYSGLKYESHFFYNRRIKTNFYLIHGFSVSV